MDGWLKQSTSIEVKVGPFVSSTDGVTPQTSLTITSSEVLLSKNEGDWAAKNESTSLVHESNGFYRCLFNTTDTNTLALLRYQIAESGCLPVWGAFLVVPANVYDSFFSTDLLQVDLTQWAGSAPNGLIAGRVQTIVGSISADTITVDALAPSSGLKPAQTGTCTGAASGSITLDASASSTTDFYKGMRIYLTSGTGAGQSRLCTAYNGSTKIATIEPNWITNPVASTTTFAVVSENSSPAIATGGIAAASFASGAINAAAIADGAIDAGALASDTITAAKIASDAITAAKIAAGAIDDDAVAADMDAYHGKAWVVKQGTTADHWGVAFFKNGQPITTGITSPTIQVYGEDGTDLIASTALTEIGSTGTYKKVESTNKITAGAIYFAKVQATIDGSTRQWLQQLGRDSA